MRTVRGTAIIHIILRTLRIYGNAGGCAFALGKLNLAEQYLHYALALNPRYRIAQNNLTLVQQARTSRTTKRPAKKRRP